MGGRQAVLIGVAAPYGKNLPWEKVRASLQRPQRATSSMAQGLEGTRLQDNSLRVAGSALGGQRPWGAVATRLTLPKMNIAQGEHCVSYCTTASRRAWPLLPIVY